MEENPYRAPLSDLSAPVDPLHPASNAKELSPTAIGALLGALLGAVIGHGASLARFGPEGFLWEIALFPARTKITTLGAILCVVGGSVLGAIVARALPREGRNAG